jgi:hypothetical protein
MFRDAGSSNGGQKANCGRLECGWWPSVEAPMNTQLISIIEAAERLPATGHTEHHKPAWRAARPMMGFAALNLFGYFLDRNTYCCFDRCGAGKDSSVLATRKPTLLPGSVTQMRAAARKNHGTSPQEPPRTTRFLQSPIVKAVPSLGVPL